MFSFMNNMIKRLLTLGFDDQYGNDLNQKHVVNFFYMMFAAFSVLMLVIFVFRQMPYMALFCVVCLVLAFVGLRYNYMGIFDRAQLIIPILQMIQITVFSVLYFSAESAFHWLYINVIVYAFVVFSTEQRFIKYCVVAAAIILFLCCVLLQMDSIYLTLLDQRAIRILVFFSIAFNFSMVVSLVMKRLKSVNQHLRALAEKDELTGLANRRKVLADAVNIFADSVMNRESCVFAIVDLDHFKKINDTFGHEAGDLVLANVAELMASVMRPHDKIGRYGGEEFIVIMPGTTLNEAEKIMEDMRQAVEDMLIETDHGIVIPVTVSIGLAAITSNISRYEEILAQADRGLYMAKRNGRNRLAMQAEYQS
ncbi:MAG: GGDEF domain-containing protein [Oceanospirillaceae bacterium]|nr:GGDEF domain-containing protein [Oceanospirillaceae bacterium]